MSELRDKAQQLFRSQFGHDPTAIAFAPGRINLIGEHTDYSEGFVFPAAIEQGVCVAASPAKVDHSQLFSADLGASQNFDSRKVVPQDVTDWGKYPAGTAWALNQLYGTSCGNLDGVVVSNLPMGAGISSSAALEVAFGTLWNHFEQASLSKVQIALAGQKAENGFIGLQSGCMDQLASALGQKDRALFIDTKTLEYQTVVVPDSVVFVLCDTNTKRELADSKYNQRRDCVKSACAWLGIDFLREADLEMIRPLLEESEKVYYCARHVVTENGRCLKFLDALQKGDLAKAGELICRSHSSLRDQFKVSSPALDAMAQAARKSTGCYGARLMGGGFGGACIAMVQKEMADEFIKETSAAYKLKVKVRGSFTICRLAEGARLLS